MSSAEKITVKKNDFIDLKYTGYANNQIFDSNIESDLKDLNKNAKPHKTILSVGHEMVVKGLDKALEGKEVGKEYEVTLKTDEAFGPRRRELIKTIPLKAFTEQKVSPRAGMILTLDNAMVKILSVSGARVITDFNNPLSGKEIKYKFTISEVIKDQKEKVSALLEFLFKFQPKFEIKEKTVIVKGPKALGPYIDSVKSKFKEIISLDLNFQEEKSDKLESKLEKKDKTSPL